MNRPTTMTLPSSGWGRAAVVALLVEAAVFGGAWWLLTRPTPPLPSRQEIQIDLTMVPVPVPEQPKPPEPEQPKVTPPQPQPQKVVEKPTPKREVRRPTAVPTPPPPVPTPPIGPVSSASSDFAQSPPPPAPPPEPTPARSAVSADAVDLFQAKARAAVQAALRYPNAARIRKLAGQCRLGFDYRDGQASNAHVVASSGYEMLDDAALDALAAAALPPPPADLAGHLLKLTITVNFSAQS
ncbi:TonB family protein [Telmatospirillum sp.]|uniref:TonB family protein n=1 Tax=Telmatospirillum sp. TaxID=2079197 RepID=UPI00283C98BB|nr:TonB family protein [Telmatospirillum sp.]MDR3435208.1 TonB family protein [Telmatospirillum sp.]